MELSNRNHDFQQQLKQITFKTYFHNRAEMLDYESLFNNRRVAVISVPNIITTYTYHQLKKFDSVYLDLISTGLDTVYALSSAELLVGPWAAKHSKSIKGLANLDQQFIQSLANFYQIDQTSKHLATIWQFVVIINNGIPEKLWYTPFKSNMQWMAIKNDMWRYRGLDVSKVLEYLKQPVDTCS